MQDLEIREDRFSRIKARLGREYQNWSFQQPFHQVGEYTTWLNTEHDFLVEHHAAVLPTITSDATRAFRKELVSQMHMEILVHGNLCKENAFKLADMLENSLKTRVLPSSQWPIRRSFLVPPGSNYVYKKTLGDAANMNHCIEYWLYVGQQDEREARAKVLLLDQILHEPAFDQLRTKEQLGYVVFSGDKSSTTTLGFRFLIQSEKIAQYLEARIENFLSNYAKTLEKLSDADFKRHKSSLSIKLLENLKNLNQETDRFWGHICTEYYDFERSRKTAEHVRKLTKQDMVDFFRKHVDPASPERAKISVWMIAQATSGVSTKQISELVKALKLNSPEREAEVATNLQARLSAAQHDEAEDIEGLKKYMLHNLKFAQEKIDEAAEALKKLHSQADEIVENQDEDPPSLNGTRICFIEDPREFKARLPVSAGARSVKDLAEYEELDLKL